MLIGEVASRSRVHARTLRFWQTQGLLADPERTPSGYRDYDPGVLTRIAFIRQAQGLPWRSTRHSSNSSTWSETC